jgi:hypothetical protein
VRNLLIEKIYELEKIVGDDLRVLRNNWRLEEYSNAELLEYYGVLVVEKHIDETWDADINGD